LTTASFSILVVSAAADAASASTSLSGETRLARKDCNSLPPKKRRSRILCGLDDDASPQTLGNLKTWATPPDSGENSCDLGSCCREQQRGFALLLLLLEKRSKSVSSVVYQRKSRLHLTGLDSSFLP
jgi:hypothetical protein